MRIGSPGGEDRLTHAPDAAGPRAEIDPTATTEWRESRRCSKPTTTPDALLWLRYQKPELVTTAPTQHSIMKMMLLLSAAANIAQAVPQHATGTLDTHVPVPVKLSRSDG